MDEVPSPNPMLREGTIFFIVEYPMPGKVMAYVLGKYNRYVRVMDPESRRAPINTFITDGNPPSTILYSFQPRAMVSLYELIAVSSSSKSFNNKRFLNTK